MVRRLSLLGPGICLAIFGLMVAVCGGPAWAQQATPILVKATIESESLIRAWGEDEAKGIEEDLAASVAQTLGDEFLHWDFGQAFDPAFATLELRVVERPRRKIKIALDRVPSSGRRETLWQEVWLEPVDFALGRRPPRDQAKERLEETFDELFNESRRQLVWNWLLSVPIGAFGSWSGGSEIDTLRIVTSLPWNRFAALGWSRIKVSCHSQGEDIEVSTEGKGETLSFTHPRLNSTYDALVFKPVKIFDQELAPADVDDLIGSDVHQIYLLEELERIDGDFFSF